MASHRVVVGINYRPQGSKDEVRAEPGDVVDDVPAKAAKAWVAAHVLVRVAGTETIEQEQ